MIEKAPSDNVCFAFLYLLFLLSLSSPYPPLNLPLSSPAWKILITASYMYMSIMSFMLQRIPLLRFVVLHEIGQGSDA